MAGSSSDVDGGASLASRTVHVASILGVKGPMRFRHHGSTQKAHVVLRRVIDYTEEGEPHVVRFSFYAQKRIEVKPGKEILVALATDDEYFKDTPLVFEGDALDSLSDKPLGEPPAQPVHETQLPEPPASVVVPPKMRRAWTRRPDNPPPFQKTITADVGVQANPTCRSTDVQATTTLNSTSVQATPLYSSTSIQKCPSYSDTSIQTTPVAVPLVIVELEPVSLDTKDGNSDYEEEMEISDSEDDNLSAMELDSHSTSASPSPVTSTFPSSIANSSQTSMPDRSVSPSIIEKLSPRSSPGELLSAADMLTSAVGLASKPSSIRSSRSVSPQPMQQKPTQEEVALPPPPPLPSHPSEPQEAKPGGHKPLKPKQRIMDMFVPAKLPTGPKAMFESIQLEVNHPSVSKATPSPQPLIKQALQPTAYPAPAANPPPALPTPQPNIYASSSKAGLPKKPLPTGPKAMAGLHVDPVTNPLGIRPSTVTPSLRQTMFDKPIPSLPKALASAAPRKIVVDGRWSASRANGTPTPINPTSSAASSSTSTKQKQKTDNAKLDNLAGSSLVRPDSPPTSLPPSLPPRPFVSTQPGPSKWKPVSTPNSDHLTTNSKVSEILGVSHPSIPPSDSLLSTRSRSTTFSPPTHTTNIHSPIPVHSANHVPTTSASQPVPEAPVTGGPLAVPLLHHPQPTPNAGQGPEGSPGRLPSTPENPPHSDLSASSFKPIPLPQAPSVPLTHPLPPKPNGLLNEPRGVKRDRPSPSWSEFVEPEERHPEVKQRPRFKWPTIGSNCTKHLQGDREPSAHRINFSADGNYFVLSCSDQTIRVWNNRVRVEIARLSHNAPIVDTFWLANDAGVIILTDDGMVHQWARIADNQWKWSRVLDAGDDYRSDEDSICFAYARDRIAVSFPRMGVKVWVWNRALSVWQPQRSILRQNVTAIKFIEDGAALIGGTRDGALWYSEIPNGTLRAYAFLKSKIISLDMIPQGTHVLVGQKGGTAVLVALRTAENKGHAEQVYASKERLSWPDNEFGAVFATKGQAIILGHLDGCVFVWDKKKGTIVYGLEHGCDDSIQAVAALDGSSGRDGCMITTTRKGQLCWWALPVAAPQNQDDPQRKRSKHST